MFEKTRKKNYFPYQDSSQFHIFNMKILKLITNIKKYMEEEKSFFSILITIRLIERFIYLHKSFQLEKTIWNIIKKLQKLSNYKMIELIMIMNLSLMLYQKKVEILLNNI